MTFHTPIVLDPQPLDWEDWFCPDCREPYHECLCDLPTYQQAVENPRILERVRSRHGD